MREPPAISRLGRPGTRGYRSLSRRDDRFHRARKRLPIDELIGYLIERRGLTDEVRKRVVALYWTEIAGGRAAARTFPVAFSDGLLRISATTSLWVQEMQYEKADLARRINAWIDANRVWLGPPPLVTEIRIELARRQREPLVDREDAQRLRARRPQPRPERVPVAASDEHREAILAETRAIGDVELRTLIESVRVKWSR